VSAAAQRADAHRFQRAANDAAGSPNDPRHIEEMMRLATGGATEGIRRWAARWLKEKCNLVVEV
jgi:hypothetical protein